MGVGTGVGRAVADLTAGRDVRPEGRERRNVRGEVRRLTAGGRSVGEGQVRGADAGPAARGVTGDGQAGQLGRDGAGGADRFGGDVAERHLGGGFVVDAVADPAGELGAEHGRALAQLGAEPLPADLQVDAGGAAELGEADQLGDHLVPPFLVLPGGDEEQFGHLVDEQHDGSRAFALGQAPDVRGDLLVRGAGGDALSGLDQVVAVLHFLDEHREQLGGLLPGRSPARRAGKRTEPAPPPLAVDADQGHGLVGKPGQSGSAGTWTCPTAWRRGRVHEVRPGSRVRRRWRPPAAPPAP